MFRTWRTLKVSMSLIRRPVYIPVNHMTISLSLLPFRYSVISRICSLSRIGWTNFILHPPRVTHGQIWSSRFGHCLHLRLRDCEQRTLWATVCSSYFWVGLSLVQDCSSFSRSSFKLWISEKDSLSLVKWVRRGGGIYWWKIYLYWLSQQSFFVYDMFIFPVSQQQIRKLLSSVHVPSDQKCGRLYYVWHYRNHFIDHRLDLTHHRDKEILFPHSSFRLNHLHSITGASYIGLSK